jgi:TetR/AcrR family transcriptional repressor of bet genes
MPAEKPSKTDPPRRPGDTALRALGCLEEIALRQGLDDVSMRDVARGLGISLAALQHHYPTKAALFEAFVRHSVDFYRQRIADVAAAGGEGSRFADVVRYTARESAGSTRASVLAMIEARAHHDDAAGRAMRYFMTAYIELLKELIAAEFPALTPRDALHCATLVCAQLEGLAGVLETAQELGADPEALLEAAQSVVTAIPQRFAIVRPPPPASPAPQV